MVEVDTLLKETYYYEERKQFAWILNGNTCDYGFISGIEILKNSNNYLCKTKFLEEKYDK